MTTDTDVDCLNIITIRLSTVFGDCTQSAEVKYNVFHAIFSSPEPLAYSELIVHPSRLRTSIRPPFSKLLSETTFPIKAKFQAESSSELGTKVCINARGHMTKMNTTPIYGKKVLKNFFSGIEMILKLGMQHK